MVCCECSNDEDACGKRIGKSVNTKEGLLVYPHLDLPNASLHNRAHPQRVGERERAQGMFDLIDLEALVRLGGQVKG
jgi:hypothetical protein